jgi:hypothetical protein
MGLAAGVSKFVRFELVGRLLEIFLAPDTE